MFFPTLELIATTDVISTDISETIYDALSKMNQFNHRSIVVVNGPLHHIITSKDLIRFRSEEIDFSTPLSQVALQTLPGLCKTNNVVNALNLGNENSEYICVCNEDGSLYGLVTNSDIVSSVDPQVILDNLQIGSIFDKKFGFKEFKHTTSMDIILDFMKDSSTDCVIIQQDSSPVGIITSKDILKFIDSDHYDTIMAHEVMSAPLITMNLSASINEALDFFKTCQFKRIVVVNDANEIMGIVTQKDLISRTYLKWSQLINEHFHQFEEMTQILQQKNQHLASLATKDALTSINNRHMFTELFAKEVANAKRYKSDLSLLIIDLDHFKNVNDTYGHNIGDSVLKTFTSIVLNLIRGGDIFARWGGEEFVLLMRHTNCFEAYAVAEKIRMAVQKNPFAHVGSITCSLGVTLIQDDDTLTSAIERADRALYEAKHQGRNRTASCTICAGR